MIVQVQMLARTSPTITVLTTMSACRNNAIGDIASPVPARFVTRLPSFFNRSNVSTQARGCRFGRPSGDRKAAVIIASARMSVPRMTRC